MRQYERQFQGLHCPDKVFIRVAASIAGRSGGELCILAGSESLEGGRFDMSEHRPVLLRKTLELLAPGPGETHLDGTFGGGGHSRAILAAGAKVIALDRDPAARERAAELVGQWGGKFEFHSMNFEEMDRLEYESFDGILLDLGVSSYQLDSPERGFSFREDAPVDMRMDPEAGVPAWVWLERAPVEELARAIRVYGEEPEWRRVVRAIVDARGTGILNRTAGLAELITEAKSLRAVRQSRLHPATLSFQGIRIAINDELGALERTLPKAFAKLAPGGRLCAIAFHSLEDRLVKRYFRELCGRPVDAWDNRVLDERTPVAEELTRKPIKALHAEVEQNPRSRSARLRAIRKLKT